MNFSPAAAMRIFLVISEAVFPFCPSCSAFVCLILAHLLWPAIDLMGWTVPDFGLICWPEKPWLLIECLTLQCLFCTTDDKETAHQQWTFRFWPQTCASDRSLVLTKWPPTINLAAIIWLNLFLLLMFCWIFTLVQLVTLTWKNKGSSV